MLPSGEGHRYGFSGEDGRGEIVPLTVAEVDREGGAWLEGHKPAECAG